VNFLLALVMVELPLSALLAKILTYQLHKSLGLLLIPLWVWRLWLLARRGRPAPVALPAWQQGAARLGQVVLYALLIAVPLFAAPFRALIGHKSDTHRSVLGWRRVPYIWFGTLMQFGGLAIMPFALLLLGVPERFEIGLAAADQFQINLGQNLAVQKRAVLFARRIVDTKAAAERIKRGRGTGELLARDGQRIDGARPVDGGQADQFQFKIQELDVEGGVVDDQLGIADEVEESAANDAKHRFVAQEVIAQAVNFERFFRDGAFGVDVLVIGAAGGHVVEQLHRANFHDAVAFRGFKARGFGIKNDFTHGGGLRGYG
jgi:hypothetical protein